MKLIVMETDILILVSSWQCWQGKINSPINFFLNGKLTFCNQKEK